jgi:hypothetical protein
LEAYLNLNPAALHPAELIFSREVDVYILALSHHLRTEWQESNERI